MTAVVGILCSDGVVIGTDSSMTMAGAGGLRTIEQPTEKLDVIGERIIIAGTGWVGHGQRFKNIVDKAWKAKEFVNIRDGTTREPLDVCHQLASATTANFAQTKTPRDTYGALFVASIGGKPVLCEFDVRAFQPTIYTERMWFCSMGSTQPITDPFLALMRTVFWPSVQPTVNQATFAVTWALDHAIAVNPGGVNGPSRIAVLERGERDYRARMLTDEEISEHRSLIEQVQKAMSDTLLSVAIGADEPPKVASTTAPAR